MTINEWQTKVDHWIKEYGVRYFNVTTNTLILAEEVGEFSKLVARTFGEQSFKKDISEVEQREMLKEEVGDIFFVLTCLANQLDMDLEEIFTENLNKKTTRDSQRHKSNEKLH